MKSTKYKARSTKKGFVIKNLEVVVEGKQVVRGIDLVVKPGEVHAIMGPNGSGKSTLAYALAGHPAYKVGREVRSQGSGVSINGDDILHLTPDQRAKRGLFLAFQYPVAVPGVSVQNFLWAAYQAVGSREKKLLVLEFRKHLRQEAEQLGIKQELLSRSLNDGFSGGEKKRVEILQLLALRPKYAILDETDSGLDIDAIQVVSSGVRRVVGEYNTGVIVITHYQRILRFLQPNFVHVMVGGRIVKSGGKELASELERKGYTIYG